MIESISQGQFNKIFFDAFDWLKKSRKHYPSSSDIWDFRRCWNEQKDEIKGLLLSGSYRFDPQKSLCLSGGETIALWSARDSLILKVLTAIIQQYLKPVLLNVCYHLKGNGGLKRAVNDVMKSYPEHRFFCKTDVRDYYDSIDHVTLMIKLNSHIRDKKVISYVWQFLNRTIERGGLYRSVTRGIARGSSLSPLLGAFYLRELDQRLDELDVKYFRYMDDVLILSSSRWKLKKAIRVLNQTFNELKLEMHPDKTIMGRTEKGFDFLGYHFSPDGLSVSAKTVERFLNRVIRLYEQKPSGELFSTKLGMYVQQWLKWATSGVSIGCSCPLSPKRNSNHQITYAVLSAFCALPIK